MKFTLQSVPVVEQPIKLSLEVEFDGSVRLDATQGKVKAELLRVTRDGRIALIVGQEEELNALGFQIGTKETGAPAIKVY